ncbi:hypothetical protein GCK32_015088 [Trichostrongylus colubriformis]|uniref:Uncharacterized protein n=1 Tax=Trichostrongylus colubriformis TaxID=6319 RepID=A0AAN8IYS8_TRICO
MVYTGCSMSERFFRQFKDYRNGLLRLGDEMTDNTPLLPWRDRNISITDEENMWHRYDVKHPSLPPRRFKVSPLLAEYLRENKYGDKEEWLRTYNLR